MKRLSRLRACLLSLVFSGFLGSVQAQQAGILREVYTGISGNSIAELLAAPQFPNSPSQTNLISDLFEAPSNFSSNYGQRLRGFIVPPVTGTYVFWISSDDQSTLDLSSDDNPTNKVTIASVGSATGFRDWFREPDQQSMPIHLDASKAYYIEALMKEGGGSDHLSVRWRLPDGTVEEPISASHIFPPGVQVAPPQIGTQPRNIIAVEGGQAVFRVSMRNVAPVSYQWQRNGFNIRGATHRSYTNYNVSLKDDGTTYRVMVANALGSVLSEEAVLFVIPDESRPTIQSVFNKGANTIVVVFSESMDTATVGQPGRYTISHGISVLSAAPSIDGRTVVLETSTLALGGSYTLNVSGVHDRAATPNTIEPGTSYPFSMLEFTPRDIGKAGQVGTIEGIAGGFRISATGTGIGGTSDQFHFSYREKIGDFDLKVRVASFDAANAFAKVGLMARENLDVSSRFASVFATPSINGMFFEARTATNGPSARLGSFPVSYPNTWLRLQRSRNLFVGYASVDGQNWMRLGATEMAITNRIQVGVALTSHEDDESAVAVIQDIDNVPDGIGKSKTLTRDIEPLGPSSRRTGLVISEIMYHPPDRPDGKSLEYVELFNAQPYSEDLSGYRLSGTLNYRFGQKTILPSGGFLVVARYPEDIKERYGITNVIGGFTNELQNSSGVLRLHNRQDAILLETLYSDQSPWPVAADGTGHSLVLARPSYGEADPRAWAASDRFGGSPGKAEGYDSDPMRSVVINEFLAHTDEPELDFIELYNRGSTSIDVSGAILTDSPSETRFVLPAGSVIPANGFLAFNQQQLGFALDSTGESIFLINPSGNRVIDSIRFGPQANGIGSGRYPDGAPGFSELMTKTPGRSNAPLRIHDLVINEIMYNPLSNDPNDEFLEIYNRGSNTVSLGGWRLLGGIEYTFPGNASIPGGGYLVIARNASQMMAAHPQLSAATVVGNYQGSLADSGEYIALAKPELVQVTNVNNVVTSSTVYVVVDDVTYEDGGRWGRWSDGGGSSLELIDPRSDNRQGSNWADSNEESKSSWVTIEHTGLLDHGSTAFNIDNIQVILLGEGECLVDNIEVLGPNGANFVENSTFESGLGNWVARGTHVQSKLQNGGGFNSSRSLRLIATARGDTGPNQVFAPLRGVLAPQTMATIRAKVRWLKGTPEILFRLHGNYLEAHGNIAASSQLGTPGIRNSRLVPNAGPAIWDVTHSPVLPAANEPVVVKARLHDPEGISSVTLAYRFDPSVTERTVQMVDNGTNGDEIAGDGCFSATIPGQAAGVMVAFHIRSRDNAVSQEINRFPNDAPKRECLIVFGETQPSGGLGTYRIWFTQATRTEWETRHRGSNEPLDATFVYGDNRVVYNIGTLYSGSPFHWGSYSSPVDANCNYVLICPPDDKVLGESDFVLNLPSNQGSDSTGIREQIVYWIADQLDHPYTYRRFHHLFVNGVQRGAIYEDSQQPNREFIDEWYPDDPDGELYKIEDWFEYNNGATGFSNSDATLQNFVTQGGQKKLARYRWAWRKRAVQDSASDYQELFNLVDAVNNADSDAYTRAVESLVDLDEWMRAIALRHIVGDWDAYGYGRGKNMYAYKPQGGKWQLLHWDIAFSFGLGDGTSTDLFSTIEPPVRRMFNHPPFRRIYLQALQEAVDGPLRSEIIDKVIDARSEGLRENGIPVTSPATIKNYISSRRKYIQGVLATNEAPFAITANGGENFTVEVPTVILSGTAPLRVRTIQVNGVAYPVQWSSISNWNLSLPLRSVQNHFAVRGLDKNGRLISDALDSIIVHYSGIIDLPENHVVINEIMYNSDVPDAEFIEIHNTSTRQSFDLSNYHIQGVDFAFEPGTTIPPQGYLVVVQDRAAFGRAYGTNIPVVGVFLGRLDNAGETLALVHREPNSSQDFVIDKVTYDDSEPWPAAADGAGGSLQLIDPAQDNNRVGNWSAAGNEWQFVSVTGTGDGSAISIQLDGSGEIIIDDMVLVTGGVPRVGNNLLKNGSFESPLSGTWTVNSAAGQSSISSDIRFGGNSSLRLVTSSAQGAITQQIEARLTPGQLYTLSYWYLPTRTDSRLSAKIDNGTLASSHSTQGSAIGFSTPGAPNSVRSLMQPFPTIRINELLVENVGGPVDSHGDRDPWIELYNDGSQAVDLSGYSLADNYEGLEQWIFPTGTTIGPSQFVLIWLDGETRESTSSELHASFRPSARSGSIALASNRNGELVLIDFLNYSLLTPGKSVGLFPDGQSGIQQTFHALTPRAPNKHEAVAIPVVINEWMASNVSTIADSADQDFDDWFELYNTSNETVDLSSYTLTDDLTNPAKWTIPSGTFIGPKSYLLVWADEETRQSNGNAEIHADFKLSRGGESIGLFASNGLLIDAVTFGEQEDDVSEGRQQDGGSAPYSRLSIPTPGTANNSVPTAAIRVLGITSSLNGIRLSWESVSGNIYEIRYSDRLDAPVWTSLGAPITATGNVTTTVDSTSRLSSQRYYRILKANPQ